MVIALSHPEMRGWVYHAAATYCEETKRLLCSPEDCTAAADTLKNHSYLKDVIS